MPFARTGAGPQVRRHFTISAHGAYFATRRSSALGDLPMFGWFKKKPLPPDPQTAYELGEQAAQKFEVDLEAYLETRFRRTFTDYLDVLRQQLTAALDSLDAPPLVLAKIELKIFNDNVDKLRDSMTSDISSALHKWMELADQTGSLQEFQRLIDHRVTHFMANLTHQGLQLLLELMNPLKEEDTRWRRANPELSAKFPPEEYPNFFL
jgi:hypothetical protein